MKSPDELHADHDDVPRGAPPLDPECEVLLTMTPLRVGDVVRPGRRRMRVVRIVPGGAIVRPLRWYDPLAIALLRAARPSTWRRT